MNRTVSCGAKILSGGHAAPGYRKCLLNYAVVAAGLLWAGTLRANIITLSPSGIGLAKASVTFSLSRAALLTGTNGVSFPFVTTHCGFQDTSRCYGIVSKSGIGSVMGGMGNGSYTYSYFPPDTPDSSGSQVYFFMASPGLYTASAFVNYQPSQINRTVTASGELLLQIYANQDVTVVSSNGPVSVTLTPEPRTMVGLFLAVAGGLVYGKIRKLNPTA